MARKRAVHPLCRFRVTTFIKFNPQDWYVPPSAANVQSKDFYNPKSREFHNPFDKGFVNNVMTVLFNRQAPVAWSHIQSSKGNE